MPQGRRLVWLYYAATPLFILLDYGFGANVRAAAFDAQPGLRAGYYLLCLGCLGLAWFRPALSAVVGLLECSANLLLLVLGVYLPILILAEQASQGTGAGTLPFGPAWIANFVIAGGMWVACFHTRIVPALGGPRPIR